MSELPDTESILKDLFNQYYKAPESRRGYKYCPCGKHIPARSRQCIYCNKTFEKGETYQEPKPLTPEEQKEKDYIRKIRGYGRVVYTPVGICPLVPTLTKDGIFEWCTLLVDYGKGIKLIYTPSVMKYWLRYFVDINSKDFFTLNKYIDDWTNSL